MANNKQLDTAADLFLTVYPRFKQLLSAQAYKYIAAKVTFSQMRLLSQLVEQPITLSELAEHLQVTRQGASLQVQELVEQGWVRRIPDPADRRSPLLEITKQGHTHWLAARRRLVKYLAGVFADFTPKEIEAFQTVFLAFQRILEQTDWTEKD